MKTRKTDQLALIEGVEYRVQNNQAQQRKNNKTNKQKTITYRLCILARFLEHSEKSTESPSTRLGNIAEICRLKKIDSLMCRKGYI